MNKIAIIVGALISIVLGTVVGCQSLEGEATSASTTASGWVSSISSDEWTAAAADPYIVTMVENQDGTFGFSTNKSLVFQTGKAYVMKFVNPAGNTSKHYFHAPEFYKAIAMRKFQTADAEYKAPYLLDVEMLAHSTVDRVGELYFVAVKAGTYNVDCTIGDHAGLGMSTTIQIVGNDSLQLDFEIPSDFDTSLITDGRKSSTHSVWTSPTAASVTMTESGGSYTFNPSTLNFTNGTGYVLTIDKSASSVGKHYFTAESFYRTVVWRKMQDSHAEIKPYYLKAVELRSDGLLSTDLYFVPTVNGTYSSECTISGHADLGMTGTINVN